MKFNIFMPKNSFRHCFAMPPPLKGRLGYTLHLSRGDLWSPAGERSSPLPDDTKNVSVSQKNGGSKPPPYGEYDNSKKINFTFNKSPQFSSLKEGVRGRKNFFQEIFLPRDKNKKPNKTNKEVKNYEKRTRAFWLYGIQ